MARPAQLLNRTSKGTGPSPLGSEGSKIRRGNAARQAQAKRHMTWLFRRLSLLQTACDQFARAIEVPILQRRGAPDAGPRRIGPI